VKTCHLIWPLLGHENQQISTSTQFQYLKTTRKSDLIQNKLKPASLGTDWIENERFRQVSAKTSVFMPKTGSINSGMAGARMQRPSFGHENQHFRENQAKTLVFIPKLAQRHR
jgi:hypothetical protein